MNKPDILWREICAVCGREMIAVQTSEDGYNMPGTKLCDYADPDGCFKSYHDECFDAHYCPVHTSGLRRKPHSLAILAYGLVGAGLFAYGLYLPGLFPGAWYTMAGGFLLGVALGAMKP